MNISEFYKPVKPTGKLASLTEEQRQQLKQWLNSTRTYEETAKEVETHFGIPGVKIGVLKNFREKHCIARLQARPFCPPFVPVDAWMFSLDEMVKALRDPKTPIEVRVRISAFMLQLVRLSSEQAGLKTESRGRKRSKGEATENKPVEEVNPLDDDEKLRQVRIEVFGSAPE